MNDILLRLERRRIECGHLYCEITGGKGAPVDAFWIPGALDRSAVSKGRSADPSLAPFRMDVVYESLNKAGCTRAEAEVLHAHHATVIEELWPTSELDYYAAVRRAQISDCSEDVCESRAHTVDNPRDRVKELERWMEAMQLHIADAVVAVAAARRKRDELLQFVRCAA